MNDNSSVWVYDIFQITLIARDTTCHNLYIKAICHSWLIAPGLSLTNIDSNDRSIQYLNE